MFTQEELMLLYKALLNRYSKLADYKIIAVTNDTKQKIAQEANEILELHHKIRGLLK